MNQHRPWPQRHWSAALKSPLTPIAVGRSNIAIDVEPALVGGAVLPRPMDEIRAPERKIARLKDQIEGIGSRQSDLFERAVGHP